MCIEKIYININRDLKYNVKSILNVTPRGWKFRGQNPHFRLSYRKLQCVWKSSFDVTQMSHFKQPLQFGRVQIVILIYHNLA